MMLVLAIILIVFLSVSVIVLTGAICALCLGFYDEIYGDLDKQKGD